MMGEFEKWEVGKHPAMSSGWIVRPVMFGSRIKVLPENEGGHVFIKNERVARLIAAAPDLYEACKRALELLEPFDDPGLSLGLGADALTPLRAALSKAGEQS